MLSGNAFFYYSWKRFIFENAIINILDTMHPYNEFLPALGLFSFKKKSVATT